MRFFKFIKSSYLRAQKELWELPLHGCIRNGMFMCVEVFLGCLEAIWTHFFEKTIKNSYLIDLGQRFDYALIKDAEPEGLSKHPFLKTVFLDNFFLKQYF